MSSASRRIGGLAYEFTCRHGFRLFLSANEKVSEPLTLLKGVNEVWGWDSGNGTLQFRVASRRECRDKCLEIFIGVLQDCASPAVFQPARGFRAGECNRRAVVEAAFIYPVRQQPIGI